MFTFDRLAFALVLFFVSCGVIGCNTQQGTSRTVTVRMEDAVLGVHSLVDSNGYALGVQANTFSTVLRGEVTALASDVIVHEMTVELDRSVGKLEFFGYDGSIVGSANTPGKTFRLQSRTGGLMRIPHRNESQDFILRADASAITTDTFVLVTVKEMVISSADRPARTAVTTNVSSWVRLEVPPKPVLNAVTTAFDHATWGQDDVIAEFTMTETGNGPSQLNELQVQFLQTSKAPLNLRLVDEHGTVIGTAMTFDYNPLVSIFVLNNRPQFKAGETKKMRLVADTLNSYWISNTLETRISGAYVQSLANSQAAWITLQTPFISTF